MSPTDKNPENVQPDAGEKPFDTAPEPRPRKDKRSKQKDSLPLIAFNNRSLREVVDDCLKAAKQANTPPRLFQQGNMLTRIRSGGPEAFVEPMTIDSLRGFLERAATFSRTYKKDGETKIVLKPLPLDYVRDILALPSCRKRSSPCCTGSCGVPSSPPMAIW